MADTTADPVRGATVESDDTAPAPRHSVLVRVTHWFSALCVFALLLSGLEIVISHPRFYWGETGNVRTQAFLQLPIPASRPWVETGYGYVMPDQNGWSRSLHFEAAWFLCICGLIYVLGSLWKGHIAKNLVPSAAALRWPSLSASLVSHLRFRRPAEEDAHSYNVLQRLSYLGLLFVLAPLLVLTGLAMSPAIVSVVPELVTVFGGHQSARTIHFLCTLAVTLFVLIHLVMVILSGFLARTGAMITGGTSGRRKEGSAS